MFRLFLLLVVVVLCLAQTPPPPTTPSQVIAAQQQLQTDITKLQTNVSALLALPQGINVETGGTTASGPTVIGTASTIDIEPGMGVLCIPQVSASVLTIQCSIDTAVVAYRVDPPNVMGPCTDVHTGLPLGAGAFADGKDSAGQEWHYSCAPTGSISPVLVWQRSEAQTAW